MKRTGATDAAHMASAASIFAQVLVIPKRANQNLIATLHAAHEVDVMEAAAQKARTHHTRQNTRNARAAVTHTGFVKSHMNQMVAFVGAFLDKLTTERTIMIFWLQPQRPNHLVIRQHQHPWQNTPRLAWVTTTEANGFCRQAQAHLE